MTITETRITVAQERKERVERIAADIDERTAALLAVLPSVMPVERFKRVAVQAVSKNPDLLACTRESLLRAIMEAAQYGLEPTGTYGGAHLVPFHNSSTNQDEATLIIGYRGLAAMATRSGAIAYCESRLVYEGDLLEMELGSNAWVRHVPASARDDDTARGGYKMVYTILRYRDPAIPPLIDYMTMAEVDKVRDSTKAGRLARDRGKGPWAEWYEAMVKKTGLRQALKAAPLPLDLADALALEDEREGVEASSPASPPSARRQRLVAAIAPERAGAAESAEGEAGGVVAPPAADEPTAAVVGAEKAPPVEAVVAERDPGCGSVSPFDGQPCDRGPDHEGVHGIGQDQTWPKVKP